MDKFDNFLVLEKYKIFYLCRVREGDGNEFPEPPGKNRWLSSTISSRFIASNGLFNLPAGEMR